MPSRWNEPWFHHDRMSAFNSALPAASQATAAYQAIDSRLRLADWRRIVIVWIVVVGVIRKVVPREKSGIQSAPEAVDKDKEVTVVKMCMASIPIPVPIAVMTREDVVANAQSPLIGRSCDCRTGTLCGRTAGRGKMILLTIRRSCCAHGRSYGSIRSSIRERLPI